ncbi:MAG: hypothetical protein P8J59_02835 [Phycisphaerales bacterium]|nr:hypothetical protein [Phycisphaerales bacterium]
MNERKRSWIESAGDPEGDFPIENLPLGVFEREDAESSRIGVPIGEQVLDLRERERTQEKLDRIGGRPRG